MIQEEWKNRDIEFEDDVENEDYVPDFEDSSPYIKNKVNNNLKNEKNSFSSKGILPFICT